jgi:hypothetical protein
MTSLTTTTVSTPVPVQRRRTRAMLLTAAAVAAATALVDLLAPPSSGSHLSTAADYAFTALLFPFALAMIAVISMLHRMQDGKDGRLGKVGYIAASVALAAFIPCGIDSPATGNAQALSPVYILAILGSLAGLILFAIGSFRARVLPRWAGPLLPLAWLLGGPVATGAVRGATLLLAAAFTVIALTLPDPES